MKRVVIFGMKRTGSNHLVALLKSHPKMQCYGEVFRDKYNVEKFLPDLADRFADVEARLADPPAYLDAIEATVCGAADAWGFKFFAEHGSHLVPLFVDDPHTRIVVLRRSNILAQFSSEVISRRTGQSVALEGTEVKSEKVVFRPNRFAEYRNRIETFYDDVLAACAVAGKTPLEVEYCRINDPECHVDILSFLELEPAPLKSRHAKRNISQIVDRFKNPDRVARYLDTIGRPEWAEEA